MIVNFPPLPPFDLLADVAREVATRENLAPAAVEKDFFLTRTIWALAETFGDNLVLKGGTLLSKVDLGYFRMSEDVDLVIPVEGSGHYKPLNAKKLNFVRDALRALAPQNGMAMPHPDGNRFEKHRHALWSLTYNSGFGPQAVTIEVSLRPLLRPARRMPLKQLIRDPIIGDYSKAYCWAMDDMEARAEKVRAACTREAGRDFFDLDRLSSAGFDFVSAEFIALVDAKLAELNHPPLLKLKDPFGLTPKRRTLLEASLQRDLPAVLRIGEPALDLDTMLAAFAAKWKIR